MSAGLDSSLNITVAKSRFEEMGSLTGAFFRDRVLTGEVGSPSGLSDEALTIGSPDNATLSSKGEVEASSSASTDLFSEDDALVR